MTALLLVEMGVKFPCEAGVVAALFTLAALAYWQRTDTTG